MTFDVVVWDEGLGMSTFVEKVREITKKAGALPYANAAHCDVWADLDSAVQSLDAGELPLGGKRELSDKDPEDLDAIATLIGNSELFFGAAYQDIAVAEGLAREAERIRDEREEAERVSAQEAADLERAAKYTRDWRNGPGSMGETLALNVIRAERELAEAAK